MVRSAFVLAVVALVGGACGSGSNPKPSGAKAAYIAKVEPICAEMKAKIGTLGDDPAKDAAAVDDGVQRIKAIKPPADDLEQADVFVQALTNVQLALQDADQSQQVNDQPRAARAVSRAKENANTAAKAAKTYGFVGCANSL
jgi:hypothetical protein